MGGIILARGKAAETTVGVSVFAGEAFIPLPGADELFDVGAPLFASESDGTEVEYLGLAESVTALGISCALPLLAAKSASAVVWHPSAWAAGSAELALPLAREIETGVALERSLGGTAYAIRVAEPRATLDATLSGLMPREADALASFLDSAAGAGLGFTLIEPPRRLTPARMDDARFRRIQSPGGREQIRMNLTLAPNLGYL